VSRRLYCLHHDPNPTFSLKPERSSVLKRGDLLLELEVATSSHGIRDSMFFGDLRTTTLMIGVDVGIEHVHQSSAQLLQKRLVLLVVPRRINKNRLVLGTDHVGKAALPSSV